MEQEQKQKLVDTLLKNEFLIIDKSLDEKNIDDTVKVVINGINDCTILHYILHYTCIMVNKIAVKYLLEKNANTNSGSTFLGSIVFVNLNKVNIFIIL